MNEYKALAEFYPTPPELIARMVKHNVVQGINSILEPSAGKGDIIDFIVLARSYLKISWRYSSYPESMDFVDKVQAVIMNDVVADFQAGKRKKDKGCYKDIECVEIDSNLCSILKGKGYRVHNEDFLQFNDDKHYDLIIMNPPFSNGDEHLLKAISIAEKTGSKIVCLLNAETIRNPYSNKRKELLKQLEKYNAEYEFVESAFTEAERKTDVDVVIVRLNVPTPFNDKSRIWEELEEKEIDIDEGEIPTEIVSAVDSLTAAVKLYRRELEAGKRLIEEYLALKPYLSTTFNDDDTPEYLRGCTLTLVNDLQKNTLDWNGYVYSVRYKYWYQLLHNPVFIGNLTSNLKREYFDDIKEFAHKDFSLKNIYAVKIDILNRLTKGIEEKILGLFEKLSYEHSLECEKNVHYFNGWASNSAFKINKKIVIPYVNCWDHIFHNYKFCFSNLAELLDDIEKCFDFLATNEEKNENIYSDRNLSSLLSDYEKTQQTKKLCFKYFDVDVFKKGTAHIKFRDEEVLKRFNLYGCQHKGWLPPSYGKKSYNDMTESEKRVIDEYESEAEYTKVFNNPEKYMFTAERQMLLLANGNIL